MEYRITDDIDKLKDIWPPDIVRTLESIGQTDELLEVVMDLGRLPTARFVRGDHVLSQREITEKDIQYVASRVGGFDADNRGGIERTLHRISAIRNRAGDIIGLTCRVGRAVYGTTDIIKDIITGGASMLMLGSPGVGKTTMLREAARILGETRRVVIVDTSNEIGGDGDIPHPAVGNARRMQVAQPTLQHEVMIEAVENHNPEVIIIDEIGRELEAQAARTIAERGVQLIGTAHGNTLENLLRNPTLSDLVGGIESVTLSDEEARRRRTQKTVLERRAPPTFDVLIEIQNRQRLVIHPDVASAVDGLLRGRPLPAELRYRDEQGEIHIESLVPELPAENNRSENGRREDRREERREERQEKKRRQGNGQHEEQSMPFVAALPRRATNIVSISEAAALAEPEPQAADFMDIDEDLQASMAERSPVPVVAKAAERTLKTIQLYAYGIARNRLLESAEYFHVPLVVVEDMMRADAVVTLKNQYRRRPKLIADAERRNIPIYVLRANTAAQIDNFLVDLFDLDMSSEKMALEETRLAIQQILSGTAVVDLKPQSSYIRRQQHQMAAAARLVSESYGTEPNRYVRLLRTEDDE